MKLCKRYDAGQAWLTIVLYVTMFGWRELDLGSHALDSFNALWLQPCNLEVRAKACLCVCVDCCTGLAL